MIYSFPIKRWPASSRYPRSKGAGMVTVDRNGMGISYGQALLRTLCRFLSRAMLGIGHLFALFTPTGERFYLGTPQNMFEVI